MISVCARSGCENIYQHSRIVTRYYCSDYCRLLSTANKNSKNLKRAKREKVVEGYELACQRSKSLFKKFERT